MLQYKHKYCPYEEDRKLKTCEQNNQVDVNRREYSLYLV